MKKVLFLVLLSAVLAGVLPAGADLIWTPLDEYLSHCDYGDTLSYVVAGPQGGAQVIDLPPDGKPVLFAENGSEIFTFAVCGPETDQWVWVKGLRRPGETTFHKDDYGFLPMTVLVPAYSSELFTEQHEEEILPFAEDADLCAALPVSIRKYPGSAVEVYEITDTDSSYCGDAAKVRESYGLDRVYTDRDGNRWVRAGLSVFEPFKEGWINIGPAENAGN